LRLLVGLGEIVGVATWKVSLEKSRQSTAFLTSCLSPLYAHAFEQDYGVSNQQLRRSA
jgi:hypothetical protein